MEKNLTVFSKEVIPVYTTENGDRVVIGRELHERLKVETPYNKWFPRMCEYGFSEGENFQTFLSESTGGRPAENHILNLDMAKHIAMIQRTPEGKAIRDRLIALETNVSELSPTLRVLINLELRQKEQARALEAHGQELRDVNQRLDGIRDVVTLHPHQWREECRRLLAKVAQARGGGGAYQEVNAEVCRLVDERARVSLETRLTNKRRRMADEGVCKSRRDRLSKVDVIADDAKLVEIYIAVVKELAVQSGVTAERGGET